LPKVSLTNLGIRSLRPPGKGSITYWDTSLTGFGCRVSCGGTKSFIVMHGAQRRRVKIGRYPILSLAEARKEAKRRLAELTLGKHRSVAIRYDEAIKLYLTACEAKNRPSTVYGYKRRLDKHFRFGKTIMSDITQDDIMRRVNKLFATPTEQNQAFATISTFMKWSKRHQYIQSNPVADLGKPAKINSRDRVLTPSELVTVYNTSLRYPYPFGPIVSLLILTGQRRSEIAALERKHINQIERTITLPGTITKNRREHTFPYGDKVDAIISNLPELGEYLFPAMRSHVRGKPTTCFNAWSKSKANFDTTLDNVEPFTLHDLRRTFDSTMASLEVPLHVSDKLLNHISGAISGVRATYNRYSYLKEMRGAITDYEQHLGTLCDGKLKVVTTTIRDERVRPANDLVDRNFYAVAPNLLWVADITYIPTWAGFLYLAVVLDAFSRRIIGWAMGHNLKAQLLLDALNTAIAQRKPQNVNYHSDQESQYTSIAFGQRCKEADVRPTMEPVGDAYDNAMCESFFATLECELLDRRKFKNKAEAQMAIFQFIEGWYNPGQRHTVLRYKFPTNYEKSAAKPLKSANL